VLAVAEVAGIALQGVVGSLEPLARSMGFLLGSGVLEAGLVVLAPCLRAQRQPAADVVI